MVSFRSCYEILHYFFHFSIIGSTSLGGILRRSGAAFSCIINDKSRQHGTMETWHGSCDGGTCRVEALSGTMLASMVDLTGDMHIFALKMDQRLMAVTDSIPWT
jgi:hypothetical protein